MGNNSQLKVELSGVFLLKSLFLCVKYIYKPLLLMCRCQEFACVTALIKSLYFSYLSCSQAVGECGSGCFSDLTTYNKTKSLFAELQTFLMLSLLLVSMLSLQQHFLHTTPSPLLCSTHVSLLTQGRRRLDYHTSITANQNRSAGTVEQYPCQTVSLYTLLPPPLPSSLYPFPRIHYQCVKSPYTTAACLFTIATMASPQTQAMCCQPLRRSQTSSYQCLLQMHWSVN